MSTSEQQIPRNPNSGLLSTNTIAAGFRREHRDARYEPEDMRTRRFGYNPGFKMQLDPVYTGLQMDLIEPGVLILFETAPVSRQNLSVDKDDRNPPSVMSELQAGEGLGAIYQQNAQLGFRELTPLRGLTDEKALDLFAIVHPRLRDAVEAKLIDPCVYGLKACECEEQGICDYCTRVCITCRLNLLNKLTSASVPEAARPLLALTRESVSVGRARMAADWRIAVGEVASVKAGSNRRMALGNLTDGHLEFMRQLHERTPEDLELDKIAANAKAQAEVMQTALAQQSATITAAMREGNKDDEEKREMRERLRVTEETLARLVQAQGTPSSDPNVTT